MVFVFLFFQSVKNQHKFYVQSEILFTVFPHSFVPECCILNLK